MALLEKGNWELMLGFSFADFHLYPFVTIKHSHDHSKFSNFCEPLKLRVIRGTPNMVSESKG